MILGSLLDFFYPPNCVACAVSGSWLCRACERAALRPAFDGRRAWIGAYAEPSLRFFIESLKYRSASCLEDALTRLLKEAESSLHSWLEETKPSLIVPAPADEQRLRERGIDHTLLIAQTVKKVYFAQAEIVKSLFRTKEVFANARLPHEARLANLKGAISARGVIDGAVFLVDDVYTSGATAAACSEELVTAGAKSVALFTLANASGLA